MASVEDIPYLFEDLKNAINEFYRKNADMDASGTIQLGPMLNASNRLDLYLKGDFQALWRLEREEVLRLREEVKQETSLFKEQLDVDVLYSVDTDVTVLQRELTIMTRCAKRMTENYRKECIEHEQTKSKIFEPGQN